MEQKDLGIDLLLPPPPKQKEAWTLSHANRAEKKILQSTVPSLVHTGVRTTLPSRLCTVAS